MRCVATQEIGPAFERQRAASRQEIIQRLRNSIGAVGMQAVVADTDAETTGNPVKKHRDRKSAPAKHKQGGDGPNMEQR